MSHKIKIFSVMLKWVCTPFIVLETGSTTERLGVSFLAMLLVSPMIYFSSVLKRYVLADSGFVEILIICLIADLATGVWKHWKTRTFDWKCLYTGLIEKVGISFIGMVVFNAIGNIEQLKGLEQVREYIQLVGKLANIFYVGGSAMNNMFVITGGQFPPVGWMKRMKSFNETLSMKHIKDKDEDEPEGPPPEKQ